MTNRVLAALAVVAVCFTLFALFYTAYTVHQHNGEITCMKQAFDQVLNESLSHFRHPQPIPAC